MIGLRRLVRRSEQWGSERDGFERRWWFFAGVWLVVLIGPLSTLWGPHHSLVRQLVGSVLIAVIAFAYVVLVPQGAFGGPLPRRITALVALAVASTLYLIFCGDGIDFTPFLVIAVVLLLPWAAGVPLALALCAAATFLPQHVASWSLHGFQWGIGAGALFAGVVVVGMRIFAGTSRRLHQAEQEIEQLGVEQERLRIARDLHDLLGHALTTVTVKAELASRLVVRDPERAAAEMAEVAELGRQSLADVRATVSGYREVSLVRELAAAREVLAAAGIEAELPAAAEDVPGDLRELFGWVVREGVTNAVRHSRARRVAVTVGGRAIDVENDGVDEAPGPGAGPTAGSGLIGLRERAALLGGHLEAGPEGAHGYRLRVEVPG